MALRIVKGTKVSHNIVWVPANTVTFNEKNQPVIKKVAAVAGIDEHLENDEHQDPLEFNVIATINEVNATDSSEVNDDEEIDESGLCSQASDPISRQVWQHDHTLALIEAVDAHYDDMNNVKKRKHFWKVISQILESNELQYSEEACKKKWANLIRTYRIVKGNKNKNGRMTTRFPFFEKIDDIVGDSPTNKNPHSIDVAKRARIEEKTNTSTASALATNLTAREENQEANNKNRKRKDPTTEYLKYKKRYYENKEKRSEEMYEKRKRFMDEMLALQKQKLELFKEKNNIEERKVRALEILCSINNN